MNYMKRKLSHVCSVLAAWITCEALNAGGKNIWFHMEA